MSARRAKLAAVKAAPVVMYAPRAAWAHPENAEHQERYLAAIAFLRRGTKSQWIMDQASVAPAWRALPTEQQEVPPPVGESALA